MNKIIQGDCLEKLKELEDNSVDSIVTDPPYELGFMGKSWDSTGIANNVELWKECLRVLKTGGHLLAFSGTRTYHRMAVAIEDAGFEVRDMIEWVYGSGFPKSLNIGKAIDKMQGNEREIVGETRIGKTSIGDASGWDTSENMKAIKESGSVNITKGTSEWEGWGTALKPAHEPICMARKPLAEKTVAENCLKYGTGGINIDESRVEYINEKDKIEGQSARTSLTKGNDYTVHKSMAGMDRSDRSDINGRFPANLIHDGSDEVKECFPETKSGGGNKATKTAETFLGTGFGGTDNSVWECDSGNASRFFKSIIYQAKASKSERNRLGGLVSIMIEYSIWNEKNTTSSVNKVQLLVATDKLQEKVIAVSGTENKHATEWNTMLFGNCTMEKFLSVNKSTTKMETNSITKSQILNWLTHCITNEYTADVNFVKASGSSLVENVAECNELITTISEAMVSALGVKNVVSGTPLKISVKDATNFHSTVKPIALMEYLIKMVTKKGGIVLDPFAGSGSTLVAAKQNGFQYIGIEMTEEYIPIIEARLNSVENNLFNVDN